MLTIILSILTGFKILIPNHGFQFDIGGHHDITLALLN